MSQSLQNSCIQNLMSKLVELSSGVWEVLRSWGWSPYGWYWCSYERDPTELQPCEDTARSRLSIYQESESHSVGSDSATPWTVTHQAPLFMVFSRQEYWSGLPFPSPFKGLTTSICSLFWSEFCVYLSFDLFGPYFSWIFKNCLLKFILISSVSFFPYLQNLM